MISGTPRYSAIFPVTDSLPLVVGLGRAKLAPVASPNHDSKDLTGVRLVQIQECRLSLC